MDPVSGLSIAANVMQVVDFSIKIISHTTQIYKAADGMVDDLRDVEKLATDLADCNTLLLADLRRIDPERHSSLVPLQHRGSNTTKTLVSQATPPMRPIQLENANPDERALADICQDCNNIANTLLLKLEEVRYKPEPTSKKNEWKAARKAIRFAWEHNEIDAIHSRLRQYREQLNTRLLFSVRWVFTSLLTYLTNQPTTPPSLSLRTHIHTCINAYINK